MSRPLFIPNTSYHIAEVAREWRDVELADWVISRIKDELGFVRGVVSLELMLREIDRYIGDKNRRVS